MKSRHEHFMRLALRQALKAKGETFPNPLVGAVLVKDKRIISTGYHKRCGSAHAEIEAFKNAGSPLRGSTLYVTLEPCCFVGRTPACTDAIINAGIKKVFVGMVDPNPKSSGKGIRLLRKNNIEVEVGFLEDELRKVNEAYIKYITKKIPFVTVKVGQSLDGKIATRTFESQWITSKVSRDYAKSFRRSFDAIMVGINTLIHDDPGLEAPLKKQRFFKIIIDPGLNIPLSSKVLRPNNSCVIVVTGSKVNKFKAKKLQDSGAMVLNLDIARGRLNLRTLLSKLAEMEITNILVEGGGTLIGSLFDQGLVDKALFFIAPKIIGGEAAISSVMGEGISTIKDIIQLKDVGVKRIGQDYLFEGYVK